MAEKKPPLKKTFKISKGTIIIVIVLLAVFAIINFVVLPILFRVEAPQNQAQLPTIKRGDVEFVDAETTKRALVVPTLIAPDNAIGKTNPFE